MQRCPPPVTGSLGRCELQSALTPNIYPISLQQTKLKQGRMRTVRLRCRLGCDRIDLLLRLLVFRSFYLLPEYVTVDNQCRELTKLLSHAVFLSTTVTAATQASQDSNISLHPRRVVESSSQGGF